MLWHYLQKLKAATSSDAPSTVCKAPNKSGNTDASGNNAGNNGGNGQRKHELHAGLAPVALPEEINDIQVLSKVTCS
jgi:hypothetical protein